jgi:DNA-binding protein H-NS
VNSEGCRRPRPAHGAARSRGPTVQWEYRKILLNEHHRREDDLALLRDAGERGWELIAITPNNVAYLKREVLRSPVHQEADQQQGKNCPAGVKPKFRNPVTGETWSGRGRMATWLKNKQNAGEEIEKYLVSKASTITR